MKASFMQFFWIFTYFVAVMLSGPQDLQELEACIYTAIHCEPKNTKMFF